MALHSAAFLYFLLPPICLLYFLLPDVRWKNRYLTVASLLLYACGQWQGIPWLLLSVLTAWGAGRRLPGAGRGKKPLLAAALGLNLLLLAGFKYLDFFIGALNGLWGLDLPAFHPPLPVGISFFTFKSMAYLIDVYRRGGGGGSFSAVLLYISFFPQASSGPITRFDAFAAQLAGRPTNAERAARGLRRFIVGLAKKTLLAGTLLPVAEGAFGLGDGLDFRAAWVGAAAYMLQLYFDFSGYSDMAIGLGGLFGFDTPENFQYPYIASSITEFWRRWHISLSSWFRDYLYIPLGGGRCSTLRKCRNKAVVFLLCGLWHGANWTFVLWGAWHGLLSALESALPVKKLQRSLPGRLAGHLYTLLAVCLGFVVFRASSIGEAGRWLAALFTGGPAPSATLFLERLSPAAWCALGAGAVGCGPVGPWLREKLPRRGWLTAASYAGAAALFAASLLAAAGSGFQPFIYAQF